LFPDFLVIGAQKAGTTWLYRNLQAHPQVWMPKEKELHYFDEKIKLEGGLRSRVRGNRPPDWRWRRQLGSRFRRLPKKWSLGDLAWDLGYFLKTPNDEWYASLFEPGRGKVTGEATPDYAILERDMISHVHELMPRAKIIFMMRNPIERPWSVLDMKLRIKGETLAETTDRKSFRRFDNKGSRLRTGYRRTLDNWNSFYPEEQIFVGFLEDVHFFPQDLLGSLYTFLGVDPSVRHGDITRKIHPGLQNTIPTKFAVRLARTYREELKGLHERFGGHASFWLYCADRLIEDPPAEDPILYPLWESEMWEDWIASLGAASRLPRFQSGLLSSVQIAK
jgi:hypothetical protein